MDIAPLHPNEEQRMRELLKLEVLDTEDEKALDDLTRLASELCETEISLISLVDHNRQWFKSKHGIQATETPRDLAFCAHAILQEDLFVVENAIEDDRFSDNPLVTEDPNIRFYAGSPLVTASGMPIGTLCVIDSKPKSLNEKQKMVLDVLSQQVVSQLELRLKNKYLNRLNKRSENALSILAHDLRSPFSGILGLSNMLKKKWDTLPQDKLGRMISEINQSSVKVYGIMDDLLQWCRSKSGSAYIALKPNSVSQLIQETLELLSDEIERKSICIDNTIHEDVIVMSDSSLMKAVIRNLFANAIKYSHENGQISFSVIPHPEIQNKVIVSISDHGVGIPEDKREMIFKERVSSQEDVSGQEGFGMGLSICGEFIRDQQGEIYLDLTYKDGAKIDIVLNTPDVK